MSVRTRPFALALAAAACLTDGRAVAQCTAAGYVATSLADGTTTSYGLACSAAGDVNGDGYGDFLVGEHLYQNAFANEGRVLLYPGSPGGLGAVAWTFEGGRADARLGRSVSTAGDVDGDGFHDVIVGVPGWSDGQTEEGAAFLFRGSATGLSTTPDWSFESDQAGAILGWSVAWAGDVNADGYDDVLVGAPLFDDPELDEGRAYLFLGGPGGLAATPAWTVEGDQTVPFAGADLGRCVATAGDVNADGYDDVVIGAPGYLSTTIQDGRALVFHGGPGGLSATPAWSVLGASNGRLGAAVAPAGDFDGDGYADLLVGEPGWQSRGRAMLYLGSATGPALAPALTLEGAVPPALESTEFGQALFTAGDTNGDGYADLVVGAPGHDDGTSSNVGLVHYCSGNPTASASSTVEVDPLNSIVLGISVGTCGDLDGDGRAESFVARLIDNGGTFEARVEVRRVAFGACDSSWERTGDDPNSVLGYTVSGAGDVDGDGYDEVIVGWVDSADLTAGRAVLHQGGPDGVGTIAAWDESGPAIGARFGWSVARAGDVDADGYGDVLVGAPGYSGGQAGEGAAFLYLGGASGLDVLPAWVFEADVAGAELGTCVVGLGDVDGDGFGDVAVGAPGRDGVAGAQAGAVLVFLGSPSGLGFVPDAVLEGSQAGLRLGERLTELGDANGDSFDDLGVGAPGYDGTLADEGRVLAYFGGPLGLPAAPDQVLSHVLLSHGDAGRLVSGGHDGSGDGFDDLVAVDGAPYSSGSACSFAGGAGGLTPADSFSSAFSTTFDFCASLGDLTGAGSGFVLFDAWLAAWYPGYFFFGALLDPATAAAGAGDVNGDGLADVIEGLWLNDGEARVYHGSGAAGAFLPRQLRQDGVTPIVPGGTSDRPDAFDARIDLANPAGVAGTPAGRSKVWVEWELRAAGLPYDGSGLVTSGPAVDSGAPAAALTFARTFSGLTPATGYRWRARFRSTNPYFPLGQWRRPSGNLRTNLVRTGADCDGSGVSDHLELAAGLGEDCDDNGVLDACDLAGGAADCNANGVPDACDVASGASSDLDANGEPDECEAPQLLCFCDAAHAPCGNPDPAAGCANSTGAGALLSTVGSTSIAAQGTSPLVLHVTGARPNKTGIWLQGASGIQNAFRDGNLCVGNPTIRLPGNACGVSPQAIAADGSIATDDALQGFDLVGAVLCKGDDLASLAPTARDYQFWFRDGMGPCGQGSNLTNAARVIWTP